MGPQYLTVQVVSPGSLVVAGPKGSLRLVGDEPEDEHHVPLIDFANSGTWRDIFGSDGTVLPSVWARTVGVLLQLIGEAGHGGAIFVVPEDSIPENLNVKYSIDPPIAMLRNASIAMQKAESGPDHDATSDLAWYRDDSVRRGWIDTAECVARLAGVDGAMLLTRGLWLRGFGSVVLPNSGHDHPPTSRALDASATEQCAYDISARGTRHRSAVVFCMQNPGAAAFVVSQDGDTSAMRNIGGTVVIWRIKAHGGAS